MKVLFCSVTICHNVLTLSIRENCTAIGSVQYSQVLAVKLTSRNIFSHPVIGLSDGH